MRKHNFEGRKHNFEFKYSVYMNIVSRPKTVSEYNIPSYLPGLG